MNFKRLIKSLSENLQRTGAGIKRLQGGVSFLYNEAINAPMI